MCPQDFLQFLQTKSKCISTCIARLYSPIPQDTSAYYISILQLSLLTNFVRVLARLPSRGQLPQENRLSYPKV